LNRRCLPASRIAARRDALDEIKADKALPLKTFLEENYQATAGCIVLMLARIVLILPESG